MFASNLDSESFITTAWESLCKGGNSWSGTLTLKRKNGATCVQQVSIAPGWTGTINRSDQYFTVVAWDITKDKIHEENMKLDIQQALETSRLKSDFLRKTAHDIRVQLTGTLALASAVLVTRSLALSHILVDTGILGMCEVLDKEAQARRMQEITVIEKSATQILTLVNDILDISQIGA